MGDPDLTISDKLKRDRIQAEEDLVDQQGPCWEQGPC